MIIVKRSRREREAHSRRGKDMRKRFGKRQTWAPGAVVRAGFLKLRVVAQAPPPSIGQPFAWILESLDGSRVYRFTPYNGLESATVIDLERSAKTTADIGR
jgi:hypothetical protein